MLIIDMWAWQRNGLPGILKSWEYEQTLETIA